MSVCAPDFSGHGDLPLSSHPREGTQRRPTLFFCVQTVRDEIQQTLDKNPQNGFDSFYSWIVSDKEVREMMTTRIVSMNSLFRHNAHQQVPMRCKLTVWPSSQTGINTKCFSKDSGLWQSLTANKTSGRNDEKQKPVTIRRYFRRRECPCKCPRR